MVDKPPPPTTIVLETEAPAAARRPRASASAQPRGARGSLRDTGLSGGSRKRPASAELKAKTKH
jgi:hypothetical protein